MAKIGIFTGTFDPVHLGHLHVPFLHLSRGTLDHVVFALVDRHPVCRGGTIPPVHRLNMLLDATREMPNVSVLRVVSATVYEAYENIPHLHRDIVEYYFLTSEQAASEVCSWPGGNALLNAGVQLMRFPRGIMPCSAHMIRDLLAEGNLDVASNWLHHTTSAYIKRHNLYKTNNDD